MSLTCTLLWLSVVTNKCSNMAACYCPITVLHYANTSQTAHTRKEMSCLWRQNPGNMHFKLLFTLLTLLCFPCETYTKWASNGEVVSFRVFNLRNTCLTAMEFGDVQLKSGLSLQISHSSQNSTSSLFMTIFTPHSMTYNLCRWNSVFKCSKNKSIPSDCVILPRKRRGT